MSIQNKRKTGHTRKVKQIPAYLSEAQLEAVKQAAKNAELPVSEFVRNCLKSAVELWNADWPDDKIIHGKFKQPPKD